LNLSGSAPPCSNQATPLRIEEIFNMRKVTSAFLLCIAACGGEEKPAMSPESNAAKVETPVAVVAATPATTEPVAPPAPKLTLAEMQVKGLATLMEASNGHDAKKYASMYAENATWKAVGMPPVVGRAAIEKSFGEYLAAFPDLKSGANYTFTKGDVTVVVATDIGTHKGDMGPMKATNKPVGWMTGSVQWWTEDGHIKEEHLFWDVNSMMSQVGMSPQKGAPIPAGIPGKTEMFTASGSEVETKNAAFTKPFYMAYEAKKPTDFLGLMTETTEWTDNTSEKMHKGTKDAKAYWDMTMKAFPDAKVAINNQWAFGDFVITESTMTGTHKGAFMGMKATGKPVNVQSLDILAMKVAKGWSFMNSAQMAEQLGMMGAPPAAATPARPAPAAPPKLVVVAPAKK
jgi:predicted ester cyclase/ketosteroid isomerase-like protein